MTFRAAVLLALCFAVTPVVHAQQTPVPAWQTAAGGAMAFEVASVRADPGPFKTPSFALSSDEWFQDPGGRFHADFKLDTYITFAYKIWLTPAEENEMLDKMPGWVKTDRFAIEAVAPPHATKDQYRLMMQSLLAERFGLKLHFEQKEQPVLAMVLVKPGKPGERLIPHDQGMPCDDKPQTGTWPPSCYSFSARPEKDEQWITGSRATTMDLLANFAGSIAGDSGEVNRRVVDQTGLTGLWDFTILAAQPGKSTQDHPGPTMLQAFQDQLGIKFKSSRAVVSLPVVDHIDRPSEN